MVRVYTFFWTNGRTSELPSNLHHRITFRRIFPRRKATCLDNTHTYIQHIRTYMYTYIYIHYASYTHNSKSRVCFTRMHVIHFSVHASPDDKDQWETISSKELSTRLARRFLAGILDVRAIEPWLIPYSLRFSRYREGREKTVIRGKKLIPSEAVNFKENIIFCRECSPLPAMLSLSFSFSRELSSSLDASSA